MENTKPMFIICGYDENEKRSLYYTMEKPRVLTASGEDATPSDDIEDCVVRLDDACVIDGMSFGGSFIKYGDPESNMVGCCVYNGDSSVSKIDADGGLYRIVFNIPNDIVDIIKERLEKIHCIVSVETADGSFEKHILNTPEFVDVTSVCEFKYKADAWNRVLFLDEIKGAERFLYGTDDVSDEIENTLSERLRKRTIGFNLVCGTDNGYFSLCSFSVRQESQTTTIQTRDEYAQHIAVHKNCGVIFKENE